MANESRSRSRKPPKGKQAGRRPAKKMKQKRVSRFAADFKPDSQRVNPLKVLRLTQLQRLRLLRWVLYIGVCVLCLVVQDTMMSRVSIFGTTTDLTAAVLLLITVLEGSEVGSIFMLIASSIYYFSGSAPGPYSVGALTTLGMAASLFRQQMLHRSSGSIISCAGAACMAYEIVMYFVGLFLGLTRWTRLPAFFFTGILSVVTMIPLYHLLHRIGRIGGYTWKE